MSQARPTLDELEARDAFVSRHIGPRPHDEADMLGQLGLGSLDELVRDTVPERILIDELLDLTPARGERQALADLSRYAAENRVMKSMIGLGYHGTVVPPVIQRNVLENPGWYTAYTPYQAEISQGRLEALLNFQTMVSDLTGMDIANASLLDEGTAAAEAMTLCHARAKAKSEVFFVAGDCHPQTIDVVRTRCESVGIELVVGDPEDDPLAHEPFALLVQYPASDGRIRDYAALAEAAHARGAMLVVAADLLSLLLLKSPGEFGADVVVGSSQRFGVPLGFGGPHAAYIATLDAHKRVIPGRLVGVSRDRRGRQALRLALQTREQHIRREKATSNICTAQVLLAVMAGMYAVYHGPEGLRRIATRVHRLACILADGLERLGCKLRYSAFFDTVVVSGGAGTADEFIGRAREAGINLRRFDGECVGITVDETTTRAEVEALWRAASGKQDPGLEAGTLDAETRDRLAGTSLRSGPVLTHPVFNSYHSETEMLRYLHRLQRRDVSLTRSMIPLGSCTMKLNATTEMLPVTWPAFADIHPFAPAQQTKGYIAMIRGLEKWLAEMTGFHAVSVQPNAGSQGEYAGLLVIRQYHRARGDEGRRICLIPSSAHGTNPASAVMAGMKVVVVACDSRGNVDVDDLKAKCAEHADALAALMITYPSTHGVFEEAIDEICQVVHDHGGQVYMDGANLNALLGLCRPGEFGPDVCHMNLHKTFCIPHGGGGPGVGPIGVAEHLAPFLPRHSLRDDAGPEQGIGAVSAAPWGSAGILPISWTYIAMMGRRGLKRATQMAILNANYIAKRLEGHYDVLYSGKNGRVAHECIVDIRPIERDSGINNEDIAKRLIDFGFHAPTMSFPVPGTLMIEPTESEAKEELDRFCDAMIAIRDEIRAVERGDMDAKDNPLKNAPHSLADVVEEGWSHPYSREQATFPLPWVAADKYWPPVSRIDNVHGDRNLVCSCPPLESYREAAE
ncbi:MAG: aminomethyl-transferring glycine dehydrogenase [Acetobacterales bacterium]